MAAEAAPEKPKTDKEAEFADEIDVIPDKAPAEPAKANTSKYQMTATEIEKAVQELYPQSKTERTL